MAPRTTARAEHLDDLDLDAAIAAADATWPVETEEEIEARVAEIVESIRQVHAGTAETMTTEKALRSIRAELDL